MQREEGRGVLLALGAVLFFSTSPVLALWADPLSPVVKAGGRLVVAALALGLALTLERRHGASSPDPAPGGAVASPAPRTRQATILRFAGYGLIAALHFLCYIAALSFTSPAHA